MSLPDKDSASTYGALNKVDYQNLPPANTATDWSNPLLAPAICNIAGMTQTIPRAAITIILNSATISISTVSWVAVWGNITTAAPTVAHVSTGVYTITFPSVVSDEYNASFGIYYTHPVNFTRGWAQLQNPGELYSCSVQASANVLTLTLYNHSNALSDFSGKIIDVFGTY